ncbi:MAG: HpcH/HpaI aldolase/citrate lyase family protein [Pseudobutyrivibrio sp.]|nr:HpcH/HpaI aldolase/citrate lyase family protein [Pseudobutyrivibrio sp.]
MKNKSIYYSVGPLLYCPANKTTIANHLIEEKFGKDYSLALCLEDTINDKFVVEAENQLANSLFTLSSALDKRDFFMPKLFIRVRNPEQINLLFDKLGRAGDLVTGIIIPKFSLENADVYIEALNKLNNKCTIRKYLMPIYESASIVDKRIRIDDLYRLKEKLDFIDEDILNIRVGGNDLCHLFGFRRNADESIHQIKPISDIFTDIITVYGRDYVISGPVWEYYSGDGWDSGLAAEIKDDKLCGFIGKTVIHPNQIAVVNEAYKVSRQNYNDAKDILSWDFDNPSFVAGSFEKQRMNEFKTHSNWALETVFLADHYGIRED